MTLSPKIDAICSRLSPILMLSNKQVLVYHDQLYIKSLVKKRTTTIRDRLNKRDETIFILQLDQYECFIQRTVLDDEPLQSQWLQNCHLKQ